MKSFASLAIVKAFIIVIGIRNIDDTMTIETGNPKVALTSWVLQEYEEVEVFLVTLVELAVDPVATIGA